MTLAQLIAAFRKRMVDERASQEWSDPEIIDFANQAEREACERAKLILDETTEAVCAIDGEADEARYDLHEKIIQVESVTWDGRFLVGTSRDQLDARYPNGWATRTGRPSHFLDPQQRTLILFAIPTTAADIGLVVYRYPLVDMEDGDDEPEIPEIHHFGLLDWMEHLAYQKQDSQTLDPQASARAEARFTARFGPKIDAETRRQQRARRSHQICMNPTW